MADELVPVAVGSYVLVLELLLTVASSAVMLFAKWNRVIASVLNKTVDRKTFHLTERNPIYITASDSIIVLVLPNS